MNDRPDANRPLAADALDRRGRAAAAAVLDAAAHRPIPVFDADRPAALPELRAAGGGQQRRWLAVAAVIVVLAAVGAAVVAGGRGGKDERDPQGPTTVTTTQNRPMRATALPDGFDVTGAYGPGDGPGAVAPASGRLSVYGPSLDAPVVGVVRVIGWEESSAEVGEDIGIPIEAGGVEGRDISYFGLGRNAVVLDDPSGEGSFVAISPTLDATELLPLLVGAQGDDDGVALAGDVLRDGWTRLVDAPGGTLDAFLVGAARGADTSAKLIAFGTTVVDESSYAPTVIVSTTEGTEADVAGLRIVLGEVEDTTVRGHRALVGTGAVAEGTPDDGPTTQVVSWEEKPGELVRVVAWGLDREQLLAAAESVEPVSEDDFAELVRQSRLGQLPGQLSQSNATVLGSSSFDDGTEWSASITEDGMIELSIPWASGGTSSATGSGSSAPIEETLLAVTVSEGDGRRALAALLGEGAQVVELLDDAGEVVGTTPIVPLTDADREGNVPASAWSWAVLEVPASATAVRVVAADGTVLSTSPIDGAHVDVDAEATATTIPD